MAAGLLLATAHAAEQTPSLLGATREQVLVRHGEPKSQIAAGNREILFYPRERIILRNGVVVEVEPIAAEPVRRPAPSESTAPANSPPANSDASGGAANAAVPGDSAPFSAPSVSTSSPQVPPPPEPKLEIKLVRPPSAKDSRTAQPEPAPPSPAESTAASGAPLPASAPSNAVPVPSPMAAAPAEPAADVAVASAADATDEAKPAESTAAAAQEKKTTAAKAARRHLDDGADVAPLDGLITGQTYAIAAIIIAGGIGFLIWRYRQRQLELAVTSVSNTPLNPPPASVGGDGALFTNALLDRLDWKRFESLVAAYYSKTGVVAARTNAGQSGPVHIKISWKGEPRPFAYVQCIVQLGGLIETKPLQELVAVLAAEDIRRGYVVTNGKFNVNARDLAEEKHITLLPGEIFIEKLNALPASARAEIMQTIGAGEKTTA